MTNIEARADALGLHCIRRQVAGLDLCYFAPKELNVETIEACIEHGIPAVNKQIAHVYLEGYKQGRHYKTIRNATKQGAKK